MGAELIVVEGWSFVFEDDGKPRIRDSELAERAGYGRSRKIRDLIKKHRADLERKEPLIVRPVVVRIEQRFGVEEREVSEFLLTRPQAFVLVPLMGVKDSGPLLVEMAYVFDAVLDGRLPGSRELASTKILAQMAENHAEILSRINDIRQRRPLSNETKRAHIEATIALGGRCQCCGVTIVIDSEGNRMNADFDHFVAPWENGVDKTWLICQRPCHADFTARRSHDHKFFVFQGYQEKRVSLSLVPSSPALPTPTESLISKTQLELALVTVPKGDHHWSKGGYIGKSIDVARIEYFSEKESYIISFLAKNGTTPISSLANSRPDWQTKDPTSWVRNNVRQPRAAGWIELVSEGAYRLTDLGQRRVSPDTTS